MEMEKANEVLKYAIQLMEGKEIPIERSILVDLISEATENNKTVKNVTVLPMMENEKSVDYVTVNGDGNPVFAKVELIAKPVDIITKLKIEQMTVNENHGVEFIAESICSEIESRVLKLVCNASQITKDIYAGINVSNAAIKFKEVQDGCETIVFETTVFIDIVNMKLAIEQ